jgi:nucleoside-diphosphate-sugar epimerase
MKKRIVISGGSGFVGRNLVEYFKNIVKTYDFTFISRANDSDFNSIGWNSIGEIISLNSQIFLHLAGKAHDLKRVNNSDEYFKINHDLTVQLFEVFLKSTASKFIFISSVKASADSLSGILSEEMIPSPQTAYGKSKLKAEESIQKMLLEFNLTSPNSKKQLYILRPCMIHGPGNKGNLNLLYKLVRLSIPWPLAAFENKRSFLSIENFCFVIDKIIEGEIESGVYQVADDDPVSTNDLIKLIGLGIGKKSVLIRIPKVIVNIIAKLGDILKFPINTERLVKLTESYLVSNSKLTKALGVSLPVKSKDGLIKTIQSFNSINTK